jgi:hypothetical protein
MCRGTYRGRGKVARSVTGSPTGQPVDSYDTLAWPTGHNLDRLLWSDRILNSPTAKPILKSVHCSIAPQTPKRPIRVKSAI